MIRLSGLKTGVAMLQSIYDFTATRYYRIPFFDAGPHPAIVVSVSEIFEAEGFFYAVNLSKKTGFPTGLSPLRRI
jgi:hypothetical protein